MSFHELLKNQDVALSMEPEELAGHLLAHFHRLDPQQRNQLHAGNLVQSVAPHGGDVTGAVMEGWAWLVREGLIVPIANPNVVGGTGFYQISRRGAKLKNHLAVDAWRNERWLPKGMLHPIIVESVWSMFIRGEYEAAVFQSFKEVEVAVRDVGGFQPMDLGVDLMRKAFAPAKGPLTVTTAVPSEQDALAHLFAGAIGSYKNPSSHRHVAIGAQDAAEMIILASHLLRIVDSRRPTTAATTP